MKYLVVTGLISLIALNGAGVRAQTDSRVESTRAVASPDGKRTAVVDRLVPVIDGEAERFSGKMLFRVTAADGTPPRQRYLEASQARVIQPPVWIGDDARVCAFVYNIAKNSNGMVYFEPDANRTIQVEFVMPMRSMAASGREESELTSFEVTEYTPDLKGEPMTILNVPYEGASVFPLAVGKLPAFTGVPYGEDFYRKLDASLKNYRALLAKYKIANLEPEQASESFSENGRWLGLLACGGEKSYLVAVPLKEGGEGEQMRLVPVAGIQLNCGDYASADTENFHEQDSRYLTQWKNDTTVDVMRETYDPENDRAILTSVASLNVMTGALKVNADAATTQTATLPTANE